ncbi:hypothetical protein [Sulfurimonas sp.]|uniref:hypothetical protein n=1 Tax=Sulfurimonas sp. TaxID=2022749 RepID=UPI0025E64177|nr:hypothetical protein [Sulfurimonas sp.]
MGLMDFFGGGIVETIGKVADDLITSDEERAEKENEKLKTNLNHNLEMAKLGIEDKKLDYGLVENETNNITERWVSDNSGNFLTKSVRPLTLIYMIVILSIMAFMDGNIGEFKINQAYIQLFQGLAMTVFVAFFGGKTIERIKGKVKD